MRQFAGYAMVRYPQYAGVHMQTPAQLVAPLYKSAPEGSCVHVWEERRAARSRAERLSTCVSSQKNV